MSSSSTIVAIVGVLVLRDSAAFLKSFKRDISGFTG